MTLANAIGRFNAEHRNNTPPVLKITWICELDHQIHKEIIQTHETNGIYPQTFDGYDENTSDETVLLVPDPYSELYIRYLAMKNDLFLNDISSYNNDTALFGSAYSDFANYFNRTFKPKKKVESFNV